MGRSAGRMVMGMGGAGREESAVAAGWEHRRPPPRMPSWFTALVVSAGVFRIWCTWYRVQGLEFYIFE